MWYYCYNHLCATDANVDSSIITIAASDSDSPSLTYAITEGNDEGYFKIDSMSGLIETARDLDREQVAVFNLLVEARDEDFNLGTTTLQVIINDVNDEAPRFLQPAYSARVTENSPRGTQVIPVSACNNIDVCQTGLIFIFMHVTLRRS